MPKHQLKTNVIYCGDNLQMLKEVPDESVDLIYIDPPFNSNRNYEVFWGDVQEKRAFEDRFGDVDAYIQYMRPRVLELYRVLKPTGSFYYHCDWYASHYVKLMLDQIFNFNNFQNEIVWAYRTGGATKKRWARKHDTIFFYTKSQKYTFNFQLERIYYGKPFFSPKQDEQGRWYADVIVRDVWDIPAVINISKERLGYPTQKPLALLERIISASSQKDDVVLDAFCGCGTALVASHKLGRKWIGIDISPTACRVMAQRLWDEFRLEEGKDFMLSDMPRSEADLMQLPPFEFQNWACVALGAIPNRVKVGDYGIDGKLYPIEREKGKSDEKGLFGDFQTAIRRDGRRKGYFVSFDFTEDAIREIKRLDKEGQIEIIPITVKELLKKEELAV
ncbi:MAG: site-specific DNA-methyltransferase [Candidatus Vogelbacteria bacterium]|nr:site-specific DNA-methyltransferase [Candidatus Vogelbacteria bacterium]